jgi:hypothetical protein
MNRNLPHRLERLETRFAAAGREPIVFRILLVNPERGLTEVLVIEGDKPSTRVAGTPEEVERVRAGMERRRAMRLELEASGGLAGSGEPFARRSVLTGEP